MIDLDKITNPRYADLQKRALKFDVIEPNGSVRIAFLHVPENPDDNIYFKHIVEKWGYEELDKELERRAQETRDYNERAELRKKSDEEALELRQLFTRKNECFNLPWVKNASDDVVSGIRRAQTEGILNAIVAAELIKYMDKTNVDYESLMDEIDEWYYGE